MKKDTQKDFPFEEITTPKFFITTQWSLQHLAGYLESWSATQKYIKVHGINPVPELINDLAGAPEP